MDSRIVRLVRDDRAPASVVATQVLVLPGACTAAPGSRPSARSVASSLAIPNRTPLPDTQNNDSRDSAVITPLVDVTKLAATWSGTGVVASHMTATEITNELNKVLTGGTRLAEGLVQAAALMEGHEADSQTAFQALFGASHGS